VPAELRADAMVRTRAMQASTIAEFFVEEGRVRVELEIGPGDIDAFRNLLPDEVHQRLGHAPRPLAERLHEFFQQDLVIAAEDGRPLPGGPLAIEVRARLRRDEITGEPLPAVGDEEEALFVELAYALPERPSTLTLFGPRGSPVAIGFVAYHLGIAVNDFRYLAPSQTLELDWDDPWYTRFEARSLRRQYFAPMSGFLYVEPLEVRKEIVFRPKDLEHWVDLGLDGRDTIPVGIQDELKRRAAAFLRDRLLVEIDGETPQPELARVSFLERSLRSSRVIDPPQELDANAAILGVIFVYPTQSLPERVTMDWDLWNERIQEVPAASVDEAGPLPVLLDPSWRVLEWQNFLTNPTLPSLAEIAPPPTALERGLALLRWALALGAAAFAAHWLATRARARRSGLAAGALALAAAAAFAGSRAADLSGDRSGEIVAGLLHNVYRAFDFRDEERVYDTLARSVTGELLERTYLETRRGLELASQGGARARVKAVELLDIKAEPAGEGRFRATTTWTVAGSVGHWGHVHERRNRYRAELHVGPVDGAWKLLEMEILAEERL
jgi:hypothetical protein